MNNYIVYEPSAKIREIAREALRGRWVQMFWGMLIFFALSSFVSSILDYFFSVVRYIPISGYYYRVTMSYAGALYGVPRNGSSHMWFCHVLLASSKQEYKLYAQSGRVQHVWKGILPLSSVQRQDCALGTFVCHPRNHSNFQIQPVLLYQGR